MYAQFGLILTVTHACNLRCSYCYTGEKFSRRLDERLGQKAVDRAVASLLPGGTLELGFFGGEPLLEAAMVARLIDYARERTCRDRKALSLSLTTNGTLTDRASWSVISDRGVDLTISCDGPLDVHDKHRVHADGSGSFEHVASTIRRLLAEGRLFSVAMVVRPDTVERLPESIGYLYSLGVRRLEPSLDVWAAWEDRHIARLEGAIARCASLWRDGLPDRSIGWFDEKAAELAELPTPPTARCGFGHGEIAVAPSGRLYPCERLIGQDAEDNCMALPGIVADGDDFLSYDAAPGRSDMLCGTCAMRANCNTICRCSNYIRTGFVDRPDRLLCAWNQACLTQTARMLDELAPSGARASRKSGIQITIPPKETECGRATTTPIF